jgi:hypothetical protein
MPCAASGDRSPLPADCTCPLAHTILARTKRPEGRQ